MPNHSCTRSHLLPARSTARSLSASCAIGLLFALGACGGSEAPAAQPPEAVATASAASADASADHAAPAPSASVSPKDQKKAEELQRDFAKLEADTAKEKARVTDAMRADLAKIESANYPDAKTALAAVLKSAHRTPGNADRDKYRHPAETLAFFGLRQDMSVLELDAGAGWYTEVLAPFLRKKGKLTVTGGDPNGPKTERGTYYGARLKALLDKAPEIGGEVDLIPVDGNKPMQLGKENAFDAVLAFRTIHNWVRHDVIDADLAACFAALKPGGVFAVIDHRAKPRTDPKASAEHGYLPEAYVIERAKAAGFELAGKSEINANPADTTDHPEGVWSLPPTLRKVADADKAKMLAIGESDRMTLKFVKPKK